jgi:glycosyltransferase involved in cell wall biosynthesis
MKILHISSPKTWRGGEQQLIYLTEELKKLGVDQLLMCPFNSAVHQYCLKHHLPHVTYFKGFSANPMVALRVAHVCKREKIDLIHVHDSHAHNFAVLSAVLTNNDLPIVVSRRVDFAISPTSMSLFKYNHPKIKRILCVSQAIAEIMKPDIQDHSKLKVIHSGIDLKRFEAIEKAARLRKEFAIPQDHAIIGCVAALAPHKDYPTLIRTAKRMRDEGVKATFIAVGEGPSRKEIEQLIQQEQLENQVILTGFRENVPALLKEFDLFLMTSETEGLGTSILDAMASGIPVVATAAGGIVELIEHGVNGWLAPVKSDEKLAEGIKKLLDNTALADQYAAASKLKATAFSKEQTAKKTKEVYEEVLEACKASERVP